MASPLKAYLDRSINVFRRNTAKVIRMDAAPSPLSLPLFSFDADHPPVTPISAFALGSDVDIGGLSTCALTPIAADAPSASTSSSSSQSHVSFHGNLSLAVPHAYVGRIRTGYAAFRNKTRPTLFGEETWDLELFTHLRVVVGYRGWEGWRSRWVVNLQTDGPVRSDLFQHRLDLPPTSSSTSSRLLTPDLPPPTFSTHHLPLSAFVLTNSGQTSTTQIPMLRSRIRTVGFGLLGGGRVDESGPPAPTGAVDLEDAGRRMASSGWGRADGEDIDDELAGLIASDRPRGPSPPSTLAPTQTTSPGYHRVGQTQAVPESTVVNAPADEGYYELCIKSVHAVRYDPEADDGEA
ncbi:hypothetical protein Q5752_002971 [Cryptotrichosporon argae]